mmetsp:Transcript_74547/g.174955  ORF Transcript_74547/g.174955 Transcript_74547/m.174955 type:complete len:106 (+) Transcript_74547:384-701(+)
MGGFAFGAVWALLPMTCSELYGTAHLGAIYNFMNFAPLIGSLVLASRVPGALYDAQASKQGGGNTCYGPDCFRTSFLINCGVLAAGVLAAIGLDRIARKKKQELI